MIEPHPFYRIGDRVYWKDRLLEIVDIAYFPCRQSEERWAVKVWSLDSTNSWFFKQKHGQWVETVDLAPALSPLELLARAGE